MMHSHFDGEVSGLDQQADGTVVISRFVTVDGQQIVVTSKKNAVSVRAAYSPDTEVKQIEDATEWIEDMALSPSVKYISIGSYDNCHPRLSESVKSEINCPN